MSPPASESVAALTLASKLFAVGQIAFREVSNNLGTQSKIFVMDSDGRTPVRLTSGSSLDANPVWSPDGRQIAFESNRDGNLEIYVLNTTK